jgi:hypothetical protein
MDRMAQHTKRPEVLRELFQAMGNDPFVIAECLARSVLVERLITQLSNEDRVTATKVVAMDPIAKAVQVNRPYRLSAISNGPNGCTDDTWSATTLTNAPSPRTGHAAVWTGSEMIVWGGDSGSTFLNTGGRYNPSTDSWIATSTTNAPEGRESHTAVWTGSEMIVWGGEGNGYLNTGGRYCAQRPTPIPTPPPPLTIIQPNGGEVWLMGSVHQIKWNSTNLKHSDHLILQYSRDGGATWFRIAQDIPAFTFGYWWQVDNFPTTQGRVKILLQENRSITDQSDANFTVQRP